MPNIVPVDLAERSYNVHVAHGLLNNSDAELKAALHGDKVMVIYDAALRHNWCTRVEEALKRCGVDVHLAEVSTGETSKSAEVLANLWNELARLNFTRESTIVALGGGVIGDLAGFVAASYLRGIEFIQIPTSLLAMVDSSVGGKTGINISRGKNLVGAFWQPQLVLADLATLETLSPQHLRAGMAEVVKYGVIYDAEFFAYLEANGERILDSQALDVREHIVRRSVEIKAAVVTQDERESGLRRILNFGHTIGHAIEAVGNYQEFVHGEAISIGMVAASKLTLLRGQSKWDETCHNRLQALLMRLELPTKIPPHMSATELLDRTKVDKKAQRGNVRYVLPTRLGEMETVNNITDEQVLSVLTTLGATPAG